MLGSRGNPAAMPQQGKRILEGGQLTMLGPELETYKGNKGFMAAMGILGLFLALMLVLAFVSRHPNPVLGICVLILLVGPVLTFLWLLSLRVTLHSDGISYHTLFGEKEMRWDAVDRFYYSAIETRAYHLGVGATPVGTTYRFKFVYAEGKTLVLGSRVAKPEKLGPKLIEYSYPALFRKVVDQFNNGQEVDFGAIRLSRDTGIKVKKRFGYQEIPWNQVSRWWIQEGRFHIYHQGQTGSYLAPRIRKIPNAFVLNGLLNSILKQRAAA
jgi:hypothetical protein